MIDAAEFLKWCAVFNIQTGSHAGDVSSVNLINSAGDHVNQVGNVIVNSDFIPQENYTPINFIPEGGAGFALTSLTAMLKGIDQALSVSDATLQTAYDNGNGEIALSASKSFSISNDTAVAEVNGVTTPSTGTNTVSNYRVNGWTFTPSIDMSVTALQYDDALFTTSETRETGIYDKLTQKLLGSVFIAQTDPLDSSNTYRTKTLDVPIQLNAGFDYVFATVIPSGQSDHTNPDAVPDSNIVISQRAELPSSSTFISLSYPESFTTVSNFVHVGSFQYESMTANDSFNVNDSTTSASVFLEIDSTTKGVIPAPKMSTANRNAISAPVSGLTVINSDDPLIRYNVYDGSAWQQMAYLSDITTIESDASCGGMYFVGNATNTTFSGSATPSKVAGTYVSGSVLKNFTQSSGTLTYTDTITRPFQIMASVTSTYNGSSNNTKFLLYLNGSAIAADTKTVFLGGVTPALVGTTLISLPINLSTSDTLELWCQNDVGTDSLLVQELTYSVISIGGVSTGSDITVTGEDYLSITGTVITADPVDLTDTNVTGILKTSSAFALTGDVTKPTGSLATTLATVNSNVGTFGSSTTVPQITVNGKGLITAASNITIPTQKIQTLAVSIRPVTSYTAFNNSFVNMTDAYIGFNTVPANTFVPGEMVELSITGVISSVLSGGSGTLQLIFGSTVLATSITASSILGGTIRNWMVNFRITCIDVNQIAASATGWFENDSHVMIPLQLYITPIPMSFDLTVDNDVNIQFKTSYTSGNGYNFIAANHMIVKYKT